VISKKRNGTTRVAAGKETPYPHAKLRGDNERRPSHQTKTNEYCHPLKGEGGGGGSNSVWARNRLTDSASFINLREKEEKAQKSTTQKRRRGEKKGSPEKNGLRSN